MGNSRLATTAPAEVPGQAARVLSVRGLRTSFRTPTGWTEIVKGISFDVDARETVAVVGESGSGKSVTALSIMRLLPAESSRIEGSVKLGDRELLALPESVMRDVRGRQMGMVFQEALTSLNPLATIGKQIAEVLTIHGLMSGAAARAEAVRLLERVRIPAARSRADDYPHNMSGGMRQRVMIAMALSCNPKLLIADEPTTALDVTIQAQILDLLVSLKTRLGMALLLITHDLGVVAEQADEVLILYAGALVERASVVDLFDRPLHPYTRGLLDSLPRVGAPRGERLRPIPGTVPPLTRLPSGCRFRDRCPVAIDDCARVEPRLEEKAPGHLVACIRVPSHAERAVTEEAHP